MITALTVSVRINPLDKFTLIKALLMTQKLESVSVLKLYIYQKTAE